MKYTQSYQWIIIPATRIDKSGKRIVGHVLLLIKETPYNKELLEIYGIGLRVTSTKTVELN